MFGWTLIPNDCYSESETMPTSPMLPDGPEMTATQDSQSLLRTIIDETPYPIILKDEHGRFVMGNRALAQLYNTTPDELRGKHDDDFGVPTDMADAFRQSCLDVMAKGVTEVVFEDSRDAATGEIRHYRSIKKPITDAEGRPRLLIIAQDISDVVRSQQKVADSEQRLQTVLRLTREGVWDWDVASGKVVHNRQWYDLLGYAEGDIDVSFDGFAQLIHPDDRADVLARLDRLLTGENPEYLSEHRLKGAQGYLWVRDRGGVAERGPDGRPTRLMGSVTDITERRRNDELLDAQRRRLDQVMEAAEIGYFEWNCRTDEQLVSDRYAQMLGYTACTMGTSSQTAFRQYVHPDDLPTADRLMQAHLAGDIPVYECELRMRHAAGHWVWIMARGKVTQFDGAQRPVLFTGTHQHVSRIKAIEHRAHQNEELLRSAVDTLDEALVIFDREDRLVFCNQRYRDCYPLVRDLIRPGVSFETLVRAWRALGGGGVSELDDDTWVQERIKAHQEGCLFVQQVEGGRYMRVVERRAPNGYIVGFRVDITELVHARQKAEAANVAKSRFLATMSHELRTPLNGILGMAQLLQQTQVSPDDLSTFTHTIQKSGEALLALLNDVLDLAKVESGKMALHPAPMEVESLVSDVLHLYGPVARQKKLDFAARWTGDRGGRYLGDANRLRQMLNNLVSNAIKFTHSGSVAVEASVVTTDETDVAMVEFSVMDTGEGIAVDKQSLLFQPFSQIDSSTSRAFGGTGLGLSIVYSLAHLMGGTVGVNSQPGRGSRFWFRVPLAPASADGQETDSMQEAHMVSAVPDRFEGHVLVVEDHPMNRMVIANMLERLGLQIHMVHDGQEALDQLMAGLKPQLIFMDVEMPVMDGYTATQCIRQRERRESAPRCPIIALTANAFDADRRAALDAGMDDFMAKPISLPTLKHTLARWMKPTSSSPRD